MLSMSLNKIGFSKTDSDSSMTFLNRFQTPYHGIGILAGIDAWQTSSIEIGISDIRHRSSFCAFGSYYYSNNLSVSYNPFQQIAGIHLNRNSCILGGIMIGYDLNAQTDFTYTNLGFRPSIGFGPGMWSLEYGYNFQLVRTSLETINTHSISFKWRFEVKELKK
jgi:hypothetical protein